MLNNPLQYFKRPVSGMDRTMISAIVCGMVIAGTSAATTGGKCYTNVYTKAHSDTFPNIAFLCKIALCSCITSVVCERPFTFQNS